VDTGYDGVAMRAARILRFALVLGGCASLHAAADAPAARAEVARSAHPSAALEQKVVELVNRHRRARGLRPLASDGHIATQARLHSQAMAAGRTPFGHDGFSDRVAALRGLMAVRRTAENVAFNQSARDPAADAVQGWLASRGHRENIEGPYTLTGVGVASNAKGEVYLTQIFVGR
jgi:uncharacterized protein YkwD